MKTKKISLWILFLIFSLSTIFAVTSFTAKKTVTETVNADTDTYKFAYLGDLQVKSTDNLWGWAIDETLCPVDTLDGAITLNRGAGNYDERYTRAVTINRDDASKEGKISFDLTGLNATRFTALIGVNHFVAGHGSAYRANANFKVYGDGVELFNDTTVYTPDSTQGSIDIDITGVKTLTLATYDLTANDTVCEHAVFANPRIYGKNLTIGQEATFLYLSELPYDYTEQFGDGCFYDRYTINESFPSIDGTKVPLKLKISDGNYQTFDKGICFQSRSKFGWDISGTGAYRFTAKVGINQKDSLAGENGATVKLRVGYRMNSGDDVDLWTYVDQVLTRNDNAIDIDLKIPYGASHLYITIGDGGDGDAFDNVTFADAKLYCDYVYLSDMNVYNAKIGYGELLNDDVLDGWEVALFNLVKEPGATHSMATVFDKCVFIHPSGEASYAVYDVTGMNVTKFSAFVGIVSSATAGWDQEATFTVQYSYDGKEWFNAKDAITVKRVGQMGQIVANVPAGATKIKVITSTVNADTCHAMYCVPRIFANNAYSTGFISLTATNDSLKMGETATASVYTASYGMNVNKANNSSFTLSSSDESVVTVNNDNKTFTAKGVGQAEIHVTYKEGFNGNIQKSTYMTVVVGSDTSNVNKRMEVVSPDGNTKIIVTLNDGWIDYSAVKNGKLFVEKSRMGFNDTSLGTLTYGFTFESMTETKLINETYKTYSGKYLENTDYCNERSITFNHSGDKFTVVARAYNDGIAFRYVIKKADGGSFTLTDEDTTICIPFFSKLFALGMTALDGNGKSSTDLQVASENYIHNFEGYKTMPFIYKTPDDVYCLVSEADVFGYIWGSVIESYNQKIVRINHSNQQTKAVTVSGETYLPWRVFIAGTLEDVIKSNMVENVATRADTSGTTWDWVEAGVTSWSWMSGVNAGCDKQYQGTPEAIIKYIDLASEMGWKYFIMDEGWQPWVTMEHRVSYGYDTASLNTYNNFANWYEGVYDWLTDDTRYITQKYDSTSTYVAGSYKGEKIIDYANKKGVKLIAWIHLGICDTEARMDKVFKMLSDIGIAGIKLDFFDSETQETMEMYELLYKKTVQYHLVANFHGSNKPSGERVTYPNIINREDINGEELNHTRVSQHTILSYVRGTVGPTDFTPYIYPFGNGNTNRAVQMAFPIIYESGVTCFASTVDEFNALPENEKYFYKNFPGRWADLKLLSGEIGQNMSIARKTEDGRWYIGSITEVAGTDTIKLDFLDGNKQYIAHIYTDCDDKREINCEIKTVTSKDTLSLYQRANGGYAVVLEEKTSYTITKAPTSNGSFSTSVENAYEGTTVTVVATPDAGYEIDTVVVKDEKKNDVTVTDNKFSMPASSVTVTVTFKAINYTITTSANNGSITVKNTATVGEQVSFTVTTNGGYILKSVTVKDASGKTVIVTDGKFTMPASPVTITAVIEAKPVDSSSESSVAPVEPSTSEGDTPVDSSASSEVPVESSSSETTETPSSSKTEQSSSSDESTSFTPAKKSGCGASLDAGLYLIPLAMFALVVMVVKKGKRE